MTLIASEATHYLHAPDHGSIPRNDNGEDIIDGVLTKLNIWHEYESIIYLKRADDGELKAIFRPDFPLFEAPGKPVCNVEVTWPDHPMQSDWKRDRCCKETIAAKERKIMSAWELCSIPTLLLNYQATIAIDRNPSILMGLLATMRDDAEEGTGQGCYYPTGDDLKSRRDWRR